MKLAEITREVSQRQTTILTLLVKLDPIDVETALAKLVRSFSDNSALHIAIDGKSTKACASADYPAMQLLVLQLRIRKMTDFHFSKTFSNLEKGLFLLKIDISKVAFLNFATVVLGTYKVYLHKN